MADVIVVGAGPTGLMLAGELALAGVDVQVLERRSSSELVGMRARGFHSRTVEILDQRGIADRFLDAGQTFAATSFANAAVDLGDLPSRHPYTLALVQSEVERILTGWIDELGVPIHRGREVVGFAQDADGVDVHAGRRRAAAGGVPGSAEGGRSTIRKAAGIDFPGWEATRTTLIAEVEVTEETPAGVRIDETGIHGINPLPGGHTVQVLVTEQQLGPPTEPTLADLSERPGHGLRHRLRGAQPADDLEVQRRDPSRIGVPRRAGAGRRRRRPRPQSDGRPGDRPRRRGRRQPRLEARPGGQGPRVGQPPGHLPGGAPPARRPVS